MNPSQDKSSARIVSLGVNGLDDGGTALPVPADISDDVVMNSLTYFGIFHLSV